MFVEDTSIVVSESGISKPEDLDRLRVHGVHIVLVGESFMKEDDPGEALQTTHSHESLIIHTLHK